MTTQLDEVSEREIAAKAGDHPVRALLVGGGQLRVLTEADLMRAIRDGTPPATPIANIAHVVTGLDPVPDTISLFEATRLMLHGEMTRLESLSDSGEGEVTTWSLRQPSVR